jgi:glutathione S-transferase
MMNLCKLLVLAPLLVTGFAAPNVNSKVVLWTGGNCPYAQRAWVALQEKGIEFELKRVDLKDKTATPDFGGAYSLANPSPLCSSKVPILIVTNDKGETQVYTESKIVLEAIEELWPEPALLPVGAPGERAKARLFGDVIYDASFGGSRSVYKLAMRKADSEEGKGTWDAKEEKKNLCESLAALDTSLQQLNSNNNGPYVLGDRFSMAECVTAPFVQRANTIFAHHGLNVLEVCQSEGYPRAAAWWKAVLERESVIATGPSPEETVESAMRLVEMMRSRSQ